MPHPRPTLSICIPTYNRVETLKPLLDGIYHQLRVGYTSCLKVTGPHAGDVEVVVSDNASDDGTAALVRSYRTKLRALTYTRAPRNLGFDTNVLRAVGAARGELVWLVGSDDRVCDGAIMRILDTAKNCPGAIIVGDVHTMHADGTLVAYEPTTRWPDYSAFWLHEHGAIARYLNRAASVRAGFGFMSNVVLPRHRWPDDAEQWVGTYYLHMFAAWQMALAGVPVVTRQKTFVYATIGHPNRRDHETASATRHAVDTVTHLSHLCPPGRDRVAMQRLWRLEYPAWRLKSLEERCKREPTWAFTKQMLDRLLGGRAVR